MEAQRFLIADRLARRLGWGTGHREILVGLTRGALIHPLASWIPLEPGGDELTLDEAAPEAASFGMDVRTLRHSPKVIIDHGEWQTGKIPPSAFPLSKAKMKFYRLGNRRWRVVRFSVSDFQCRLLINYNPELAEYQAMLGVEGKGDTKVVVSLEHHGTHGGWHAHASFGDLSTIPSGVRKGPWMKRLGAKGKRHRMPCPSDDDEAFDRAVSFFRLDLVSR